MISGGAGAEAVELGGDGQGLVKFSHGDGAPDTSSIHVFSCNLQTVYGLDASSKWILPLNPELQNVTDMTDKSV